MGILGRRKNDYSSEDCILKNILKYSAFKSWVQEENVSLIEQLELFFTLRCNSEEGWLRQTFGDHLLSNEIACFDLLVLIRALLARRCKQSAGLYEVLRRAWGVPGDAQFPLDQRAMLTRYFSMVEEGVKDVRLTDHGQQDMLMAFERPSSLIHLIMDNAEPGSLRRRWIENSKHQLKPMEVKLFRLQACLLLGSPETVGEVKSSVLNLLCLTWDTKNSPVKKYVAQYYRSPDLWLGSEVTIPDDSVVMEHTAEEVTISTPACQQLLSSPQKKSFRQRMASVMRTFRRSVKSGSSSNSADMRNSPGLDYEIFNSTMHADTPLRSCDNGRNCQPAGSHSWEISDSDNVDNLPKHEDEEVSALWEDGCRNLQDDFSVESIADEELSFDAADQCSNPLFTSFLKTWPSIMVDVDSLNTLQQTYLQRVQDSEELFKRALDLAGRGCPRVRRTMEALLLGTIPIERASQYLIENGYSEQRRSIVTANRETREARKNANAQQVVINQGLELTHSKSKRFDNPFSNRRTNKKRQEDFCRLCNGEDIAGYKARATKITHQQTDCFACFVAKNCQFRPGKSRNSKLNGVKMQGMPFYIRYGSLDGLFKNYRRFAGNELSFGRYIFNKAMKAVTATGLFNSGLSYFWVDFIELMTLAIQVAERLQKIADDLCPRTPVRDCHLLTKKSEAETCIASSVELTKFTSLFLRHTFYGTLVKSSTNGFRCMRHALGEECDHEHEFLAKENLSIALSSHIVLHQAIQLVGDLLDMCRECEKIEATFASALAKELACMADFTVIMQKEVLHFTKHTVRQCWQDLAERELESTMRGNPSIKRAKCDHKNKTLAQKLMEPMSEYFSKHGMSDFGTYLTWWGEKDGVEGWFSMYIDMIMENTTSQESRDLLPCVEALVEEIQSEEMVDTIGPTSTLLLGTDNALTSLEVSVFVSLLNRQNPTLKIGRWENKEAQTFKFQGDTHFHFVNVWIAKAIMHGGLKLTCPRTMFDCLAFDGGMKASTTILLRERHEAQEVHDQCKSCLTKKDKEGIKSVHCQTYSNESLVTSFFSNLSVGETIIPCKQFDQVFGALDCDADSDEEHVNLNEQQKVLPKTGDVLRRHQSQKGILFTPFVTVNTEQEGDDDVPDQNTLAGRVYASLLKYSSGLNYDFFDPQKDTSASYQNEAIVDRKLCESTKEERLRSLLMELQTSSPRAFDIFDTKKFPPTLEKFWAKKKNRGHLEIKPEVKKRLHEMYEQGVGYKNKNLRYTAEQACSELSCTLLVPMWDQKYICRVSKIKSLFGAKFRDTQKQQDGEQGNNTSSAHETSDVLATMNLVKGNIDAEHALMNAMSHKELERSGVERRSSKPSRLHDPAQLAEATLAHFGKLPRALLHDFAKARVTSEDERLPKNKGTVADARRGVDNLIARAWNLRCEPLRADMTVMNLPGQEPEGEVEPVIDSSTEYDDINTVVAELTSEHLAEIEDQDSESDNEDTVEYGDDKPLLPQLLALNREAERKLATVMKRSTSIADAGVSHFVKLTESQLIAFIQARDPETVAGGSKPLPKKKGSNRDWNCLVGIAFSLRSSAIAWQQEPNGGLSESED